VLSEGVEGFRLEKREEKKEKRRTHRFDWQEPDFEVQSGGAKVVKTKLI